MISNKLMAVWIGLHVVFGVLTLAYYTLPGLGGMPEECQGRSIICATPLTDFGEAAANLRNEGVSLKNLFGLATAVPTTVFNVFIINYAVLPSSGIGHLFTVMVHLVGFAIPVVWLLSVVVGIFGGGIRPF